ncbi:MAG: DUF1080 domain-containing protein, partial [Verrucomicrobia bacterium]|nr:DUF1080 domain-containing protein [Verrucomicrobiota bacterium]
MTAILAFALIANLLSAENTVSLQKPDAEGWINLFNGKDLTGWNGDPKVW